MTYLTLLKLSQIELKKAKDHHILSCLLSAVTTMGYDINIVQRVNMQNNIDVDISSNIIWNEKQNLHS